MRKIVSRAGWVLSGVLGLILIATLAESAFGGPLDPPGPVGSTYLTLDDLQPTWGRKLSSTDGGDPCHSSRFRCVMDDVALLDRETGLVWTRNPSLSAEGHWYQAVTDCFLLTSGGRAGWRLPTVEELMSVYDMTNVNPDASLPDAIPLTAAVDADGYWSSTSVAGDANLAYIVDFLGASPGSPGTPLIAPAKSMTGTYRPWCVRGSQDDIH